MNWCNLPRVLFLGLVLCCQALPARATFNITVGAGPTQIFAFDAGTTPAGTGNCAASNVECYGVVPMSLAGTAFGVVGLPFRVDPTGTTVQPTSLNTTPTIANGNGVVPTIAGAVYSATNGAYFNQLQGNAVLSATNGGFSNILQGNAVLSATNGLYANLLQGNAVLAAGNPIFVSPGTGATWAATQSGNWTSRIVGNGGATMDVAVGGAAAPTNALVGGLVYNSSPPTPSSGQALAFQGDLNGNLKVAVQNAIGVAENTAVGSLTFSVLGAEGLSTEKTAVTTGNYGRLVTDLVGKVITMPYAPNQLWVRGTTAAMTATTSTQLIAATASFKTYLTQLTCGNSHATVGTFVNVQDGSGGATLWTIPAASVYGGATLNFTPPIPTTSGNGVYVVDATTGANVICSGNGYTGV